MTGTDTGMSDEGTVGLDWVLSGAWGGVRDATEGGTSSRGASTHCSESCLFSAGGYTDSHTQTHAN